MNDCSFKVIIAMNRAKFKHIQGHLGGTFHAQETPDKRQAILDAAVKVFAGKGFFRSRVSEIAREAGVADGTIYLYFKNKDDILISIFELKMQEVIRNFRNAVAREKDAVSRMECLIRMHLEEFQANPDLAAVFQVELRRSSRFMREYRKRELREYLDLIGEIIRQGQQEDSFDRICPGTCETPHIRNTG